MSTAASNLPRLLFVHDREALKKETLCIAEEGGLAVTEDTVKKGTYSVTHLNTGYLVANATKLPAEVAITVMRMLAKWAQWERLTFDEMVRWGADPDRRKLLRAAIEEAITEAKAQGGGVS